MNLQKTWQGIKEIINLNSKNYNHPNFIKSDNGIITDEKNISSSFNKYFSSVTEKILNNRKYEGRKSHLYYLSRPLSNSFVIRECDHLEVENIMMDLSSKKACGPNSIPVDIMSLPKSDISKPLSKIFNLSLLTDVYPDKFKIAKTIPIFKKGDRHLISNYRPISLLPNLNKLLEKIMFERTYRFLTKFKCLYKLQFFQLTTLLSK